MDGKEILPWPLTLTGSGSLVYTVEKDSEAHLSSLGVC